MTRNRLPCRLAAAALGLALLAPPAALAQGPRALVPNHGERSVLAALWDFVSGLFPSGETKNRGQMDPNGLTGTATADPGGEHRGQIDPDGLTVIPDPGGEHRGQMDPNG
ncbi:MAG: hypothetical protein JF614_13475 [Acidobacteria bacterium]|nr:hypothetical protein [Acidobacteriota bacterium]